MSLKPTNDFTHVVFVENNPEYTAPLFYKSNNEAVNASNEIIEKNIKTRCQIFQIRTILEGKTEILREDFSHATK